ncbi:MAG TPA: sensor histidine kinase [Anaerolineaceae bacterium]|nr:sensor histidine kinase [Anaerolineaceae bacterium]
MSCFLVTRLMHTGFISCYNKCVKNPQVNPALISAFRVFAGVMLLLGLFPIVSQFFGPPSRFLRFLGNPYVTLIEAAVLLAYLSWPWLQSRLGRLYLPIAIAIATLAPIIANFLGIDFTQADELAQVRSLAGQWQVIFLLFVPLILIAWQYSFRIVVFYCLALAAIDLVLILIPTLVAANGNTLPPAFGNPDFPVNGILRPWLEIGPVVLRTAVYLLIGYVVSKLVASEREQTARLEQAYRQLANYATTNEQLTLSHERNRLARELHDTLAHTLSAVAVQLEAISSLWESDRPKAHDLLVQSLKLTRDGLNETRRAIQSLRAAPIEDLGLVMALSNLVRSVAERSHLSLELSLPESTNGWSPEIEHTFYRITEEALRNVTQHAGAHHLAVSLQEKTHHLTLTIQDDGRGFSFDNIDSEQRFGIQGMRERAESIGASFSIKSEPGRGTTLKVAYPPVSPELVAPKSANLPSPEPGSLKAPGERIG